MIANYYLELIKSIFSEIIKTSGLRNKSSKILGELAKEPNIVRSFILFFDDAEENFSVIAAEGFNAAEFRRLENNIDKPFIKSLFGKNDSVFIKNTADENWFAFLESEKKSGFYSCPIKSGNKTFGILGIETLEADSEDATFAAFLSVISSQIAQIVKTEAEISNEKERISRENLTIEKEIREKYNFANLIGNSSPMRQIYNQIAQVARSNATVLLRGESGTGKELIAKAIHYNSLRAKKPLIAINCAALPETLIESELFGYEKGAFTGANIRKKGRFELADGGTIFLDEIGDIPPQTQVKLLRVLQERKFERLGGTETISVNVRLITATNRNLEAALKENAFREDLYYRLNVFTIFLPPLRERKSDILLLAEYFLEKYEKIHDKHIRRISTPAIDMLTAYHYPGNVRELENAIERAVVACDENVIHGHHLPPTLQTAEISDTVTKTSLDSAVAAFEKDLIQDALKTTGGNCSKAANLLNTTERIFNYKIKKYAINTARFKN